MRAQSSLSGNQNHKFMYILDVFYRMTRLRGLDPDKQSTARLWIILTVASVILLGAIAPARAAQVRIPLTIDYITLREDRKSVV